jgi:hypothetical protein
MLARDIAGHRWYLVAAAYPTAVMARRAWERCERKLDLSAGDEGIGLYRLAANPEGGLESGSEGRPAVVAVTLDEATGRKAERLLRDGEPWEPTEGFANAMIARRARVVTAHAGETGRLIIRRPEGKGGSLDPLGRMREQDPGQG